MIKHFNMRYLVFVGLWLWGSAQMCTKEIVRAKEYWTQPVQNVFKAGRDPLWTALVRTLTQQGYKLQEEDKEQGLLWTGWQPVEAGSHYAWLFERKDYGVSDGAYYQLKIQMAPEAQGHQLTITGRVKSLAGPLETSKVIEKRILNAVKRLVMGSQLEITNVEVKSW
jgi:hypothetical protein